MRHAERELSIFNFNNINSFVLPKRAIPLVPRLNAFHDRMCAVFSTASHPTQHHGLTSPSTLSEKSRLRIVQSHLPPLWKPGTFSKTRAHAHTHIHTQSAGFMSTCNSILERSVKVLCQQLKLSLNIFRCDTKLASTSLDKLKWHVCGLNMHSDAVTAALMYLFRAKCFSCSLN